MSEIELLPGSADRKARYVTFCDEVYIPIYSKPWWMDAVCGPENWDVWLHEDGSGRVDAAMPYYLERREHGLYITKAPLTQTNGITFRHPHGAYCVAKSGVGAPPLNLDDPNLSRPLQSVKPRDNGEPRPLPLDLAVIRVGIGRGVRAGGLPKLGKRLWDDVAPARPVLVRLAENRAHEGNVQFLAHFDSGIASR